MFLTVVVAVSFVYRLSSCVNFTSFFDIKLFFFSTLLNIKLLKYINFNLVLLKNEQEYLNDQHNNIHTVDTLNTDIYSTHQYAH
jgi:hypothetical protein